MVYLSHMKPIPKSDGRGTSLSPFQQELFAIMDAETLLKISLPLFT